VHGILFCVCLAHWLILTYVRRPHVQVTLATLTAVKRYHVKNEIVYLLDNRYSNPVGMLVTIMRHSEISATIFYVCFE